MLYSRSTKGIYQHDFILYMVLGVCNFRTMVRIFFFIMSNDRATTTYFSILCRLGLALVFRLSKTCYAYIKEFYMICISIHYSTASTIIRCLSFIHKLLVLLLEMLIGLEFSEQSEIHMH